MCPCDVNIGSGILTTRVHNFVENISPTNGKYFSQTYGQLEDSVFLAQCRTVLESSLHICSIPTYPREHLAEPPSPHRWHSPEIFFTKWLKYFLDQIFTHVYKELGNKEELFRIGILHRTVTVEIVMTLVPFYRFQSLPLTIIDKY